MANFWKIVNEVIERADVVLEVLDSRLVEETRNEELEKRIEKKGKPIILVLNKCDLVSKEFSEKQKKKLPNAIFVSSLEHLGTTMLRSKILATAKKKEGRVIVGVVGYPNTGKSSIINALKGKSSAKASSQSGYTKALQLVKADNKIMLIDTPGVIPFRESDEVKHALMGAKDADKVKEPDIAAMQLIEMLEGKVEEYYGVESHSDAYETIEEIAIKQKKIKKGNEPNVDLMSRLIIKEWQRGKLKR